MGLLEQKESQSIPDAFGVPSYYVHKFFAEPAGPGDVRLYACATINGVLVPQYLAVMPALSLLTSADLVREVARQLLRGEGASGLH
jgi:hypothetical protein